MSTLQAAPDHGEACAQVAARFMSTFDSAEQPRMLFSPYRLCPLGAHVDHQFGPVLACAIDHGIHMGFMAHSNQMQIASSEFEHTLSVPIADDLQPQGDWADHARGAVSVMRRHFDITRGVQVFTQGGRAQTGLSSSAAVGVGYLAALAEANGVELAPEDLARLDVEIERGFLGLKNGILDPAAIALGREGSFVRIDTRTCDNRHLPVPDSWRLLALHSGISQALTPGNFNSRVEESYAAAGALTDGVPKPLGDVPLAAYQDRKASLDETQRRRAEHFFSESDRVDQAVAAVEMGDAVKVGQLMRASSASSVENYECGATAVKDLVGILNGIDEVMGARFCGPGFRGCAVALVDERDIDTVFELAVAQYRSLHSELADASWGLNCRPSSGLRLLRAVTS